MKLIRFFFLSSVLLADCMGQAELPTVVLDPLIDWKNPFGLTLEKVQNFCSVQPLPPNNKWVRVSTPSPDHLIHTLNALAGGCKMTLGPSGLLMRSAVFRVKEGKMSELRFGFEPDQVASEDFPVRFGQMMQGWEGGAPPVFGEGSTLVLIPNQVTGEKESVPYHFRRFLWQRAGHHMLLERVRLETTEWTSWALAIHSGVYRPPPPAVKPADTPAVAVVPKPEIKPAAAVMPKPEEKTVVVVPKPVPLWQMDLKADLDPLLELGAFWQATTAQFEEMFIPRIKPEQAKPPQFEWLSASKDRARFSRQLLAQKDTKLTLFSQALNVEEAVVEFVNGRAARSTVSIYNRGDAGQMGHSEFQTLFKWVEQNLSEKLKVTPRRIMGSGSGAVKNVAWMWSTPQGVALLEHNDFLGGAVLGQPEYLRLKLAAPDQADWTMGRMSMGVQRISLQKNVVRDAGGDVFISGVPMVDQGAKGYCVAASCQRLLEYMRIPCDQHEMAQLLNVDAETGANSRVMQKSLAKVDQKFGVTFKSWVNPELFYSTSGKRRVSLKEFASIIKEHADKGVPLLWALELGRYAEEPALPRGGQVGGGHMRMVIGYNASNGKLIFTDSWGAGHEKKTMPISYAYEATLGLFSMTPRGL
ncbi:MAG: C39 family peptidase [Verrucomicrobiota bacterium]